MSLNLIPHFDFSNVDEFFKLKNVAVSRNESTKGYKYFSEDYIHEVKS